MPFRIFSTLFLLFIILFLDNDIAAKNDTITKKNLIYNPSFEDYLECPKKIESLGMLADVIGWWQPTTGSSDYFNKCGKRECGVPENKLGIQMPRTGNAYCGFYLSKTEYREYLSTELKETLIAGERYKLTFYVSLAEYSTGAIATIGGLFTSYRIKQNSSEILTHLVEKNLGNKIKQVTAQIHQPQVVNSFDNPITNTTLWTEISGEFTAEGNERFLTIGNFYPIEQSNYQEPSSLTYLLPGSYYYLDDVEVICLTCLEKKKIVKLDNDKLEDIILEEDPNKFPPGELGVGKTFVLENIFFEFDKSTLLPESFIELERLVKLLQEHPNMRIEILGHTDNKGSIAYNIMLSNERAKSVVNYLIKRDVAEKRLKFKGYGKSQPISTNETEEGRAKNRRVEFKILDM